MWCGGGSPLRDKGRALTVARQPLVRGSPEPARLARTHVFVKEHLPLVHGGGEDTLKDAADFAKEARHIRAGGRKADFDVRVIRIIRITSAAGNRAGRLGI